MAAAPWRWAVAEPMGRIVALEGRSGVGKSRLLRFLLDRHPEWVGIPEAYERLRPRPSLDVPDRVELGTVERRLLREERRRYREAIRRRAEGRTVILDTGPFGPLTYAVGLARLDPARDVVGALEGAYRRAARDRTLGVADLTLRLSAPDRTVRARVRRDRARCPARGGGRRAHRRLGEVDPRVLRGERGRRALEHRVPRRGLRHERVPDR